MARDVDVTNASTTIEILQKTASQLGVQSTHSPYSRATRVLDPS